MALPDPGYSSVSPDDMGEMRQTPEEFGHSPRTAMAVSTLPSDPYDPYSTYIAPAYRQEMQNVPILSISEYSAPPEVGGWFIPPRHPIIPSVPDWTGPAIAIKDSFRNPMVITHEQAHAYSVPRWGVKPNWSFAQEPPGFQFSMNPQATFDPFRQTEAPSPGFFFNPDMNYQNAWESFARAIYQPNDPPLVPREYGFTNPMEAYATWAETLSQNKIPVPLQSYYPWLRR